MRIANLRELFVHGLARARGAEEAILAALPAMEEAALDIDLKEALARRGQAGALRLRRLDQVFERMGEAARSSAGKGFEGVLEEGAELIAMTRDTDAADAAIVASGEGAAHLAIAAYRGLAVWAQALGLEAEARLLIRSLQEVEAAERALAGFASDLAEADFMDEEDDP